MKTHSVKAELFHADRRT